MANHTTSETRLANFDLGRCLATFIETAKQNGYTVKEIHKAPDGRHPYERRYQLRRLKNDELGVKALIEIETVTENCKLIGKIIQIDYELRDERGRYRASTFDNYRVFGTRNENLHHIEDWEVWLNRAIDNLKKARGATITDPPIKTIVELATFPPLKFTKPGYVWNSKNAAMAMHCFYKACRIQGVATILPDLKISIDEVNKPNADPWFYIIGECSVKRSGAAPEIIVNERDGELVFYPVRGKKVTNDLRPINTHIDYSQMSELDAILIHKAIAKYLE